MTGIPRPTDRAGSAELAELVERAVRSTGDVVELYPPRGPAPRAAAAGLERLGLSDAVPRVAIDRRPDRTHVEVALGVRSSVPAPVAVRRVREAIATALGAAADGEVVVRATVVHVVD